MTTTTLPRTTYEPTDTVEGEYVVLIEEGSSIPLDTMKITPIWTARIYFARASDGTHELAMTCSSYWKKDDPQKRRTRAKANVQLGRLRSHLKRTGRRWEYERHVEHKAKQAAERAEHERKKRIRAAAEDLLEALTKCRDRFFPADQPERDRDLDWDLVNAAIAKAKAIDA